MKQIKWLPRAEKNLADIVDYVFERNPVAAINLQELAFKSAENLMTLPMIGRIGRVAGTRELIIHPNYCKIKID